jgi:NADPH-dependent F420 reductase
MKKVRDIMVKNFNIVARNETIAAAYQKIKESNNDTTLIMDQENKCIGIITLWNLIRAKALCYDFNRTPVYEIMSFPVITVDQNKSLDESINLMLNNRIKNIVVIDDKQTVVGLVSAKNIIDCDECVIEDKTSCILGKQYKIAIIGGTGKQGRGLALRWAKIGHHIIIGSRNKENAEKISKEINDNLKSIGIKSNIGFGSNTQIVKEADIIVLTIPYSSIHDLIILIKDGLHPGQIIVSPIVPLKVRDTGEMGIDRHRISAAEKIYLMTKVLGPNTVAAFHTIPAINLSKIDFPLNFDVIVAGDDGASKKIIMNLISQIPNLRPLDGGSLKNAETLEYLTSLAINIGKTYKKPTIGLKFI